MKNSFFLCFLICLPLMVVTSACSLGKKVKTGDCSISATVKDFRKLDGCSYLFVLDDGTQLFANNLKELEYKPINGQRVKISYEELKNYASVCMAEDKIIKITCIEVEEETCVNTNNPIKVDWIRKLETRIQPSQIIKFEMNDLFAYHFMSKKKSYLYDCRGNLLCESDGPELGEECREWTEKLKNPIVIWVVDY
jgi:hypothetical protein